MRTACRAQHLPYPFRPRSPLLVDSSQTTRRLATAAIESNIGFLIQSPFGCCIQASMIMVMVSILVDYWSIMHPKKLSENGCNGLLALRMSAFGTKRTFQRAQSMSAFGGKADITRTCCNVCFGPKAGPCYATQMPLAPRERLIRNPLTMRLATPRRRIDLM